VSTHSLFNQIFSWRQAYGLSQRIIVAISIPLVLIFCASCFWDYRIAKQTSDAAHDVALGDVLNDLEELIQKQSSLAHLQLTPESEAMIRSNSPDRLFFAVRDVSGKTLLGDHSLPQPESDPSPHLSFFDGVYQNEPIRIALHQIRFQNVNLEVQVVETLIKREKSSQKFLAAMVIPNLITMIIVLLAVLWGVRQGLKPLRHLETEIERRSVNDLRELELAENPFELRPLLQKLNELFKLLNESNLRQQRFIADAAHQLRTPLAGLQTQIDLAIGEGIFDNSQARKENIQTATYRIEHLLSQLLSYARAESAIALRGHFKPINLRDVVENSATSFIDRALAKNIDLGFDLSKAEVVGLAWMLQEALSNLIDNAIRYTPAGGVVTVKCGTESDKPFLEVEDSGSGIPEHVLPSIFQRFHHAPGTRDEGCGLGLSIVHQIVQVHDASIKLINTPNRGFVVRINFMPLGI
jgi:two-component system sensor histidine kinase TctE